jgi:hypothetical protein
MKKLKAEKLALIILFFSINTTTVFGQVEISGKYIRTEYPGGYLILNPDNSFTFKFNFDLQWDLACRQYEARGDTIFFNYNKDMFDSDCNTDKINVTDTSGVISIDAIDKRYRPITAQLLKKKILTLKVGDIKEPETVELLSFYYRAEKKRKRKREER